MSKGTNYWRNPTPWLWCSQDWISLSKLTTVYKKGRSFPSCKLYLWLTIYTMIMKSSNRVPLKLLSSLPVWQNNVRHTEADLGFWMLNSGPWIFLSLLPSGFWFWVQASASTVSRFLLTFWLVGCPSRTSHGPNPQSSRTLSMLRPCVHPQSTPVLLPGTSFSGPGTNHLHVAWCRFRTGFAYSTNIY